MSTMLYLDNLSSCGIAKFQMEIAKPQINCRFWIAVTAVKLPCKFRLYKEDLSVSKSFNKGDILLAFS